MKKTNPNFLNGVPELLILKLLDNKEMYGYELVREIRSSTNDTLSFGEGCVYPILHSLEKSGMLTNTSREVNGRTRLYYKTTKKGKRKLEIMSGEWFKIAHGIGYILGGEYKFEN
jgi:PadR family transcriptional regulator, regulatory protein PadR